MRTRPAPSRHTSIAPACVMLIVCAVFFSSACVATLSDDTKYSADGDVSGSPADCSIAPGKGVGGPTGDAAPRFIGRFVPGVDDQGNPLNFTRFQWSGSEITARFTGTQIIARLAIELTPQGGGPPAVVDPNNAAYASVPMTVTIDGQVLPSISIATTPDPANANLTLVQDIPLASDLTPGVPHEIVLHRDPEAQAGVFRFYQFTLPDGQLLAPTVHARSIEIIGDQITTGFGDLGQNSSCPQSFTNESHYFSYGAIVGRMLSADVTTIAWSNLGLARNASPDLPFTIPALYEKALPDQNGTDWNFQTATEPDVVVMTFGAIDTQNGGVPTNPDPTQCAADFVCTYASFIGTVRSYYPDAVIFLATPPTLSDHDADAPRAPVHDAIQQLIAQEKDPAIFSFDFLDQGTTRGLGCQSEPNLVTQQIMATQLATAIHEKLCW